MLRHHSPKLIVRSHVTMPRSDLLRLAPLVLAAVSPPVSAQQIVRDLVVTPSSPSLSIQRGEAVVLGNRIVLALDDGLHGLELWISDGTPAGTQLVRDIETGSQGSRPRRMQVVGNRVYFTATRWGSGAELWVSDGTPAGTRMVLDLTPSLLESTEPSRVTEMGGVAYFVALEQLWRTDGTAVGTASLHSMPAFVVSDMVAVNNRLFFVGGPSSSDLELWVSDTVSAGLVRDIHPGGSGVSGRLHAIGNRVAFVAYEPTTGAELWVSDGTAQGTVLTRDIRPGAGSSTIAELTAAGGAIYFVADDGASGLELWWSDGTGSGTVLVSDLSPGPSSSAPRYLCAFGGGVAFSAFTPVVGRELWFAPGQAGAQLVADIVPGVGDSSPSHLLASGASLVFAATDQANDVELWQSDATGAGTSRVADLLPGTSSSPVPFVATPNRVFLEALTSSFGRELWSSDLSASGTLALGNFATGPGIGSECVGIAQLDQRYVLASSVGLWVTRASGIDADLLASVQVNAIRGARLGAQVVFSASTPTLGEEPWVTDGTMAGTRLLAELTPGAGGGVRGLAATPSFLAIGGPVTLHVGRGNLSSLTAVSGGPTMSVQGNLVSTDSLTFFVGHEPTTRFEVWRTDGSNAGTFLTRDVHQGSSFQFSIPRAIVADGGRAFFTQRSLTIGEELWVSDGSTAGTTLAVDVHPTSGGQPELLAAGYGLCFFTADDGSTGRELWCSDGTPAGSRRLVDIVPGAGGTPVFGIVAFRGGAVFFAHDPHAGIEPWFSDGTVANTRRIVDLMPGPASSIADVAAPGVIALRVPGGAAVAFVADDGNSGSEVWVTDGTSAGTRRLSELAAGPRSFAPSLLGVAGGKLYLTAHDERGREPWTIDLAAEGVPVHEIYGAACEGPGVAPLMREAPPPRIGGTLALQVVSAPPLAPGVHALGTASASIPMDAGTCRLLVGGVLLTLPANADAAGRVNVALPVPGDVNLIGAALFHQVILLSPSGTFLGVAVASDGAMTVVGR